MSNIAEIINKNNSVSAIDLAYEASNHQRRHLGLSQCGHKCKRFLWYKHHGYDETKIPGRTLRIFQMGNMVEDQLFIDFAKAGFTIRDAQKEVCFHQDGIKLIGHIDGIIAGLLESKQPHLYECKSVNDKGFKKFLKKGYEQYSDSYKFQIHAYALALNLTNIFVVVYNKNDSSLYQERIKLKKAWIIERLQDVFATISGDIPDGSCPSGRLDWYERRWCNFRGLCKW